MQTTFRNIKFANNIHSSGGYFMWPPGAYTPARVPLPYPPYGTLNFFDQTATTVLDGIKSHRGTAIHPQQTGPVIDVLYSAAGNSADEAYYANGIIGYDFEIGATHYNDNYDPNDRRRARDLRRRPAAAVRRLDEPLPRQRGLPRGDGVHERQLRAPALRAGLRATTRRRPSSQATGSEFANVQQNVRFTSSEATSIYYTTDGSTPTTASTEWKPNRARALPVPVAIADDATLKWIAKDFKGNLSGVGSKTFMIETDKPDGDPHRVRRGRGVHAGPAGAGAVLLRGRGRRLRPRELRRLDVERHARHQHAGHVHLHGDRDRTAPATRRS